MNEKTENEQVVEADSEIYYGENHFIMGKYGQFDLWDPNIEWYDCPKELALAILLVQNSRSSDYTKFIRSVHILDRQVITSDGFKICRSRIPNPAPFEISINPGEGIPLLESSSFFESMDSSNRVLTRLAKMNIGDRQGIVWDFGDLHAWCISDDDNHLWTELIIESNTIFEGKITTILKEVSDDLFFKLNNFYEDGLYDVDPGYIYHPIMVEIESGKMRVFNTEGDKTIWDEIPLKIGDCCVKSVTFKVDAMRFCETINRKGSLGIIDSNRKSDVLYYKESEYDCEHVLACEIKELTI